MPTTCQTLRSIRGRVRSRSSSRSARPPSTSSVTSACERMPAPDAKLFPPERRPSRTHNCSPARSAFQTPNVAPSATASAIAASLAIGAVAAHDLERIDMALEQAGRAGGPGDPSRRGAEGVGLGPLRLPGRRATSALGSVRRSRCEGPSCRPAIGAERGKRDFGLGQRQMAHAARRTRDDPHRERFAIGTVSRDTTDVIASRARWRRRSATSRAA